MGFGATVYTIADVATPGSTVYQRADCRVAFGQWCIC